MGTTTFKSSVIYNASDIKEGVGVAEKIKQKIDSVVEYPGSVKGDSGHWVLTEWVEAKIEKILTRSGRERL